MASKCECGHDFDSHAYSEKTLQPDDSWCDECECEKFVSQGLGENDE